MKKIVAGAFVMILGGAAAASATPIGPVYPPPTGVTYTPTGSSGRDSGLFAQYDITDFSLVSQLWWGLTDVTGPLLSPSSGTGTGQELTYSGTTADGAIYTSSTNWTISTAFGTVTEPVRLVLNIYDITGTTNETSSMVSGSSIGLASPAMLFPVTSDFSIRLQFQAFNGSTWDSVLDTFDALHTGSCTSCVATATNGGFYYTPVPEPASLMLFGSGLLGAATRLRRRTRDIRAAEKQMRAIPADIRST